MKNLIIATSAILSFMTGTFAQASNNEAGDMGTIICHQNTDFSPDVSKGPAMAVLTQIGKYNYDLTVSRTDANGHQNILVQTEVYAYQEDVMISFDNKKKKVSFHIYADELEQSSLSARGLKIHFTCSYL